MAAMRFFSFGVAAEETSFAAKVSREQSVSR